MGPARDEDLVGRLARGDQRALAALVQRWDRPLHAFFARHTGDRDVEDLRQETWLRVVRGAARFDRERRFSTWLFAVALNLCRDWARRRPASPLDPSSVERALGAGPARSEHDPLDARTLLDTLPEAQRSAVVLRYYHDLTEDEMAEILDVPKGTVKSRLHHAVRRMLDAARGGGGPV